MRGVWKLPTAEDVLPGMRVSEAALWLTLGQHRVSCTGLGVQVFNV